ncbi:MAG: metallophosphoesterase [Nitrospiraceae bacterium]|nr:metallophosphoesterase [Nitrospiraceae bacterium]
MSLFIFIFFGVYGGMHAYAFLRARTALGFGWPVGAGLALFMVVMTAVPLLVRALERGNYDLTARVCSWIGYLWIAFLFLFICSSLLFDAYTLLSRISKWSGAIAAPAVSPAASFFASVIVSCCICIYGYFDAQHFRTEVLTIETDRLPAGTDSFRIVQISDVHLGLIIRCDRLVAILETVKAAKPDLFVVTGDLVDAQINNLPGMRELLQEIEPKFGKFAVTGNHEYYAGIEQSLEFIRRSGFTLLRGESKDLGVIQIAGVDDRTAVQLGLGKPAPDREALAATDRKKKFVLFLKHQPHPDADAIGMYDLMLSGHTHKGQIWPFTYVVQRVHPLLAGTYDLGKGSSVHTNRGTGTWGPPIRFLASPEVTVIELVRPRLAR